MTESTKDAIICALKKAESLACELSEVLDNLNSDNEQEYALGAAILNLSCEIYTCRNKTRKILDAIK